jgi:hypothetical protein
MAGRILLAWMSRGGKVVANIGDFVSLEGKFTILFCDPRRLMIGRVGDAKKSVIPTIQAS